MTGPSDQIKQSDVTLWGLIALGIAVFAVISANVAAIVPPSVLTGLHATRLEGGSLNNLRMQVADLRNDTAQMRNENNRLLTMIRLANEDQSAVTQRVGAIESTLPVLLNRDTGSGLDSDLVTSSIGDGPEDTETRNVDGGSVEVTRHDLGAGPPETPPDTPQDQPMPEAPPAIRQGSVESVENRDPPRFGIALGPKVTMEDAYLAWQDIRDKAGPLLIGLGPLLSGNAGTEQQRLVAGPINDYAQAEQLCARVVRIGISCLPVPYAGEDLPE